MASSVPCKFFARGCCRNGNSCRFLHDFQENTQHSSPNNAYRYIRSSVLSENRSQNSFSNSNRNDQDREIKQNVIQDVAAWENGDQWLFSCFAPIKDGVNFPEFNDVSPEELRWNAYQAEKQGTIQTYREEISNLASEIQRKREILKNPSPAIMETLIKIFNNSLEKDEQTANLFGSSASAKPSFSFKLPSNSTTTQSTSLFGNQENVSNSMNSPFPTATFGSFGSLSTPVGQSGFGQNQPMQTNNTFNQNADFKNQQSSASSFSFATPSPMQSNQTNSETKTPNQQQSFGFSTNKTSIAQQGFGLSTNVSNNLFGRSEEISTKYTDIKNLSEEEKQQFMNSSFTLGLIPEKPPPRELV